MLVIKSIVIILLFTFILKSTGLQCYQGTQMGDSEFKTFGSITLTTCPPKSVCFKGMTTANSFDNFHFGCAFYNNLTITEIPYLNNTCFTDGNLFFKCFCNDTDGCNHYQMDKSSTVAL